MVAILANSSTSSPDIEMVTSILNTATEIQEELSPETQVIKEVFLLKKGDYSILTKSCNLFKVEH